jgi:uncharacterized protein
MKPRFDGQPQVDAYGDFGFRLAGQRFESSVLLTPRGLYPWPIGSLSEAGVASLAPIGECAGEIDFLIVGYGTAFARFPKPVAGYLAGLGITPDFMDTGAACRTYNVLLAEDRRVAAALVAVA